MAVLVAWQCESTCNRREKLAKILLRMGCYTAALKLQPTCEGHNMCGNIGMANMQRRQDRDGFVMMAR